MYGPYGAILVVFACQNAINQFLYVTDTGMLKISPYWRYQGKTMGNQGKSGFTIMWRGQIED